MLSTINKTPAFKGEIRLVKETCNNDGSVKSEKTIFTKLIKPYEEDLIRANLVYFKTNLKKNSNLRTKSDIDQLLGTIKKLIGWTWRISYNDRAHLSVHENQPNTGDYTLSLPEAARNKKTGEWEFRRTVLRFTNLCKATK